MPFGELCSSMTPFMTHHVKSVTLPSNSPSTTSLVWKPKSRTRYPVSKTTQSVIKSPPWMQIIYLPSQEVRGAAWLWRDGCRQNLQLNRFSWYIENVAWNDPWHRDRRGNKFNIPGPILGWATGGWFSPNIHRNYVKIITLSGRIWRDPTATAPKQGASSLNFRTSHTQTASLRTGTSCTHGGTPRPFQYVRKSTRLILLTLDGRGRFHEGAQLRQVREESSLSEEQN